MQVGTTKDQGLHNKPYAAVHPGALAAGTLPYNITLILIITKLCCIVIMTHVFKLRVVLSKWNMEQI